MSRKITIVWVYRIQCLDILAGVEVLLDNLFYLYVYSSFFQV